MIERRLLFLVLLGCLVLVSRPAHARIIISEQPGDILFESAPVWVVAGFASLPTIGFAIANVYALAENAADRRPRWQGKLAVAGIVTGTVLVGLSATFEVMLFRSSGDASAGLHPLGISGLVLGAASIALGIVTVYSGPERDTPWQLLPIVGPRGEFAVALGGRF